MQYVMSKHGKTLTKYYPARRCPVKVRPRLEGEGNSGMGDDNYSSYIGSLLAWLILPSLLAQFVLGVYYGIFYAGKAQRPKKGSKAYERHYSVAYTVVIVAYFAYCIVEFVRGAGPTYYDIIGVQRVDVDGKLKTHFKHLIISLHPDKNPHADPSRFMQLKQTYEVLNNEVSRPAYDCYGPEVLKTVNMSSAKSGMRSTLGEYFMQAFYEWVGFYVGTLAFLAIASGFRSRAGLFWRIFGLTAIASLELYVLMRPQHFGAAKGVIGSYPGISFFTRLWYNVPTFYKLALMKRGFTYGCLGIAQIMALFKQQSSDEELEEVSKRIEVLASVPITRESDYHLATQLDPVADDEPMQRILRQRMGRLAAELQLFDALDDADRSRLVNRKPN